MNTSNQTEAMTENPQLPAGPVLAGEKSSVAYNAFKHGIFAKNISIASDGSEESQACQQLLRTLKQDFTPQGQMEHLLVEKIAVNYWRLRRVMHYEVGEIQNQLEGIKKAEDLNYPHQAWKKALEKKDLDYFDYNENISEQDIQEQEKEIERLTNLNLPLETNEDALEFIFYSKVSPECEEGKLPKDWKAQTLTYLKKQSPQIHGKLRKAALEHEKNILWEMKEVLRWNQNWNLAKQVFSIPNQVTIDKILKYETALERSIERNLKTLRELQSCRLKAKTPSDDT